MAVLDFALFQLFVPLQQPPVRTDAGLGQLEQRSTDGRGEVVVHAQRLLRCQQVFKQLSQDRAVHRGRAV